MPASGSGTKCPLLGLAATGESVDEFVDILLRGTIQAKLNGSLRLKQVKKIFCGFGNVLVKCFQTYIYVFFYHRPVKGESLRNKIT